jgi:hypothetical protein
MSLLAELENHGIELWLDGNGGLCLGGLRMLAPAGRQRALQLTRRHKGQLVAELEARCACSENQAGSAGRDISGSVGETCRSALHEAVSVWRDEIEDNTLVWSEAIQSAETALPARQEDDDDLPSAENVNSTSVGKLRRCRTCWKWENIRSRCWWVGRCTVDGHEVASNSVCRLGVVSDESWRLFLPAHLPPR